MIKKNSSASIDQFQLLVESNMLVLLYFALWIVWEPRHIFQTKMSNWNKSRISLSRASDNLLFYTLSLFLRYWIKNCSKGKTSMRWLTAYFRCCSMNCEVAYHPINLWNLLFVFLTLITSHIDNTTNPFSSFIQEPFTVDYCLSTFKLSTVVTFEYHLPFTVFLCLYDCRSCIRKFLLSLIKSTFNSLSCDI